MRVTVRALGKKPAATISREALAIADWAKQRNCSRQSKQTKADLPRTAKLVPTQDLSRSLAIGTATRTPSLAWTAIRQVQMSCIQTAHIMAEASRISAVDQCHMQLGGTGRVSTTGQEGTTLRATVGKVITGMATAAPTPMAIRRMQLRWQRSRSQHLPTCCVSPATPRKRAPTK